MSKFKLTYPSGATPLDPNEIEGLIPDYITTQRELKYIRATKYYRRDKLG